MCLICSLLSVYHSILYATFTNTNVNINAHTCNIYTTMQGGKYYYLLAWVMITSSHLCSAMLSTLQLVRRVVANITASILYWSSIPTLAVISTGILRMVGTCIFLLPLLRLDPALPYCSAVYLCTKATLSGNCCLYYGHIICILTMS